MDRRGENINRRDAKNAEKRRGFVLFVFSAFFAPLRFHMRCLFSFAAREFTPWPLLQTLLVVAGLDLQAAPAGNDAARSISNSPTAQNLSIAGWTKYPNNPVLGGAYGTCFDVSVLKDAATYRMWFSWRPKASIALVESKDGFSWSTPEIVLGPDKSTGWENDVNRPVVLKKGDTYHMWYSAFNEQGSSIGYATSSDAKTWRRMSANPVMSPSQPWERVCLMCPHVLWDESARVFKMWYSAGERNEPNAIGYATSPDGLNWARDSRNPIFVPDPDHAWERHKVTACQVIPDHTGYIMFYIGFRDEPTAQIGVARSRDGITGWERHPANPIIRPTPGEWDADACYKPFAIYDGQRWLLWYNGRRGGVEQIGVAIHEGRDLGFPAN